MMRNKRKSTRVKGVLPVKMCIGKSTDFVHTIDITDNGAQLGGIRTRLQPGNVVSLRRGSHKANFRIAWIRELGPNEVRAGIECMEPQNDFWDVNRSARSNPEETTDAVMGERCGGESTLRGVPNQPLQDCEGCC